MKTYRFITLLVLAMTFCVLHGCSKDDNPEEAVSQDVPPKSKQPTAVPAKSVDSVPTAAVLNMPSGNWMFTRLGVGQYKIEANSQTLILEKAGDGYQCNFPQTSFKVKWTQSSSSYKVYGADESLQLKLKIYPDKYKIMQSEEDNNGWSIKEKTGDINRYRILRGEKEIGAVKYYPDNGKLKAKDMEGKELAVMRTDRRRAAPAVAFMDQLTEDKQIMVYALLTVIDK